jgi:excisionase family DNA binding protein
VEDQTRSLSEVAGLMGVSERTVRRWIKSGRLKAYKPGRDYRIPESGLRTFIEESEISSKAQAQPSQPSLNDGLSEQRREDLDKLRELLAAAGAETSHLALPEEEFKTLWEGKPAEQRARINQELREERQLIGPLLQRWTRLTPGSQERNQLHDLWLQVRFIRFLTAIEKNQEAAQAEADAARQVGDETRAEKVLKEAEEFASFAA